MESEAKRNESICNKGVNGAGRGCKENIGEPRQSTPFSIDNDVKARRPQLRCRPLPLNHLSGTDGNYKTCVSN